MKLLAKQNRELIMINPQNTQNENDAEKIILQVPEQYEDFNKKIVFITPDGNVWDIITNNEYLIKKAITKYKQVDFYIWLTKGNVDFRSQTKTLKFYHNVDASEEITDEEIGRVNTVINLLEEEITKVENLETEIDGKLEEIDTAIDNVNTAIQEVENLDLDAEKVGQTTTVTLTKKDGTTKVVHVDDGVDLQFMWQGTSLGIKTAEQQEYTFVNLQGVQGQRGEQGEPFTIKKTYSSVAEMNADFNNMQLGDYVMIASTVEVEDNAKLYTRGENQWIFITDFSGATGIRGETGLTPNIQIGTVTQGTSFNVTRTGTNENPVLNFTLVKGDKGDQGIQGIQGLTGNGISSITKTGTSGLVDTYTITYTNGNTTTFTITNGEDGEVTETELNVLRQKLENQQKVIDQLPQVEGQGTSITLENTIEAPFTIFDVEGNSVQDGSPSPDNEVPIKSAGDNENLFDIETSTAYQLCTKSDDVFTTSAMTRFAVPKIKLGVPLTVINGTDYYISYDVKTNSGDAKKLNYYGRLSEDAGLNITTNFGELIGTFTMSNSYQRVLWKTTATSDFTANYLFLQATSEITNAQTISIKNIKISEVNTKPYSPYGMGSINEKIQNKNIISSENIDATFMGVKYLSQDNGTILANGKKYGGAYLNLTNNIVNLENDTYSSKIFLLNGSISRDGTNIYPTVYLINQADTTKSYSIGGIGNPGKSQLIEAGTYYLRIATWEDNVIFANAEIGIMLVKGSTIPTAYVEHEEQDYSIFVQQPIRSIGDVRDCFVKKSDGKLYERHLPYIASYNGETLPQDVYNEVDNVKYCNEKSMSTTGQFSIGASVQYIDENNWNDLPCTEEQIQQLENLPSTYKDFTIIQSEDETPAYLEVSGIYDLNKLINN